MGSKECSKCGETSDLENFRKNKRYKGGHVTWCKPCEKSYHKDQRNAKSAENAKYQRKYAKDNAEKIAARKAKYYQENKERVDERNLDWKQANPSKVKVIRSRSQKNTAAKCAARTAKYIASKAQRTVGWANEQAVRAFYEEAARLEQETGIKYHVDHIIPLNGKLVSGLHVESNLQVIPANENLSKSNRYEVA